MPPFTLHNHLNASNLDIHGTLGTHYTFSFYLYRFSFNVVHFALCHIYSGVSTIPDSISIVELATIADMLGLEGLKEAIMFTLKAKYCHHFHRVNSY